MTEEQLRAMTEDQIRSRYRCAPAYYLRAKLEKKRALEGRKARPSKAPESGDDARWQAVVVEQAQPRVTLPESPSLDIEPATLSALTSEPAAAEAEPVAFGYEPMSLDIALPGFEILDAALYAVDYLDPPAEVPAEEPDCELTQQAILEAALEDYSNWPFVSDAEIAEAEAQEEPEEEPEAEPQPELEHKLQLVLEAEPDLELVLEGDPELDLVLDSESGASENQASMPDNVTVGDFRSRAPRTVRVVSVVMDKKRPYLVRVVGETTRLAS